MPVGYLACGNKLVVGFIHEKPNPGIGGGLMLLSFLKLELLFPVTWYFWSCCTLSPCAGDSPCYVFLCGTNGTRFLNMGEEGEYSWLKKKEGKWWGRAAVEEAQSTRCRGPRLWTPSLSLCCQVEESAACKQLVLETLVFVTDQWCWDGEETRIIPLTEF